MNQLDTLKQRLKNLEEERMEIQQNAKGFFGFLKTRVFSAPYRKLKKKFKQILVDFYMHRFYPDSMYEFNSKSVHGKDIVRKSELIRFDECSEEDVLQGSIGSVQFYLSEIDLIDVRETTDSEGSTEREDHVVFSGILFSIGFENRNFPKSKIHTKAGMLKKFFTKFENHDRYDFSYQTEDKYLFEESLNPLFPFIEYLQKNQGNVLVSSNYNEITILLKSSMKFLDDAKPKLADSFMDGVYYRSIAQQLNSLFFILESFAEELDAISIENTLKNRLESIDEEDIFAV